jgi:glycosyltransferase involved in cell wall biosynthesis
MSEFLLTIVTVTKNCAGTIGRTLDSVQAVKRDGIEYVVVDGVSSDGTLEAIHQRGALVDHCLSEHDSGIYNAMNKAVGLAKGKYILFINGDDELVADGFSAVMAALADGRHGIVCATTLVGDPRSPSEVLAAIPRHLPSFNAIPHPSSFVARDLLLRWPFREDLRIVSDYDFFLRAYLAGQKFHVLPVVTAIHQRGGASGNVVRSQAELDQVRRDQLGGRYFVVNAVAGLYRWGKGLVGRIRHG